MKVYLASAIDQNPEKEGREVVEQIRRSLGENANVLWVYNPYRAFSSGNSEAEAVDESIRAVNQAALDECNAVVAILPSGVPSIGVPMEVEWASSRGIPTLIVSDVQSWAWPTSRKNVQVVQGWDASLIHWLINNRAEDGPKLEPLPYVVEENAHPLRSAAYPEDAGLDLVTSVDTWIWPGELVDVPSGVSVQLPSWSWGMIAGRSSTIRKKGLQVHMGVVDAGYRGSLFAACQNLGTEPVLVRRGERVAQLIVMPNGTRHVEPQPVEALEDSDRGSNGFGSTGG